MEPSNHPKTFPTEPQRQLASIHRQFLRIAGDLGVNSYCVPVD